MAQWFEMLMEGVERNLASRNRERYSIINLLNVTRLIKMSLLFCLIGLPKICLRSKKN